ncbi:MAG TPA: ubiquitin-like domain-containing protein [Actinotalea sp.]
MPFRLTDARLSSRREGQARLVAQALVLCLVVAATSAFAALHKTVTVDVDGLTSTSPGFGRTVGDVLRSQGVTVADGDLVVPAPDELIADAGEIVVRHRHQVTLEIDGKQQSVWTTALTVGDVLADLNLRDGVRASASRSSALGDGLLRLSTVKTVHVAVDGATQDVSTAALTVREVLQEQGVVLGEHDQVSVPLDAAAVDGLMVMVTRVQAVPLTETTPQPFETVRTDDPTLAQGREVVSVRGRDGSSAVTYVSYQVAGVEVGRDIIAQAVLAAPVTQQVRVGTKAAPVLPPMVAVTPGSAREIGLNLVLARGWSVDQFACLDSLFSRESGWRVDAHNSSSGAYGIPQALPGSKMATVGADWQTNPATQITWGLNYISARYGTPCGAWAHSQSHGWY